MARTFDPQLTSLYEELSAYPCDDPEPAVDAHAESIFVPFRIRYAGHDLAFFSTIATFGTALDITIAELAIESFFPADEATGRFLRETWS
jgi:hypothetical protein